MSQTDPHAAIHYIHDQPESLLSRIVKRVLALTGAKARIEKAMISGKIDQRPAPVPRSLAARAAVSSADLLGRPVWHLAPKEHPAGPVVLFLHGGAYVYNISRTHWAFLQSLLGRTSASFVVPDYPLAPAADAREAIAFLDTLYARLLAETDAAHVILMGDSAGGGLALAFAQHLRDEGRPLPRQIILLSPWLDITMTDPAIAAIEAHDRLLSARGLQLAGAAYAGTLAHDDYRVSPLHGDLHGLPPIALFTGTHDLLHADAIAFASRMEQAGLPLNHFVYPAMIHDWVLVTQLKEAGHAIGQIAALIG
jgi:acetyl esterase/lipase